MAGRAELPDEKCAAALPVAHWQASPSQRRLPRIGLDFHDLMRRRRVWEDDVLLYRMIMIFCVAESARRENDRKASTKARVLLEQPEAPGYMPERASSVACRVRGGWALWPDENETCGVKQLPGHLSKQGLERGQYGITVSDSSVYIVNNKLQGSNRSAFGMLKRQEKALAAPTTVTAKRTERHSQMPGGSPGVRDTVVQ